MHYACYYPSTLEITIHKDLGTILGLEDLYGFTKFDIPQPGTYHGTICDIVAFQKTVIIELRSTESGTETHCIIDPSADEIMARMLEVSTSSFDDVWRVATFEYPKGKIIFFFDEV